MNPGSGASSRDVMSDQVIYPHRSSVCILARRPRNSPTDLSLPYKKRAGCARRQQHAHAGAQCFGSSVPSRERVFWEGEMYGARPDSTLRSCAHPDGGALPRCCCADPAQHRAVLPRQRRASCGLRQTHAAPRAARRGRRRPSAWACSARRERHGTAGSRNRAAAGCR